VLTAVVLLICGALVATGLGEVLGLSFASSTPPPPAPASSPVAAMAPAPAITRIKVAPGERLELAASAVVDALTDRGAPAPRVSTASTGAEADANAAGDLTVQLVPAFDESPEAFRVVEGGGAWRLEAADEGGAASGLYTLADHIRSGAPLVGAGQDGVTQRPRLGLRLTDSGSVGREAVPAEFAAGTDYSLNSDVVAGAVLPQAPWVDQAAVERIDAQFRQLVQHSLRQGYNGVVVPGFLEYVTFSGVEDGHAVYADGDEHIARAEAMVRAFAPVFGYAHDMGMKVYFMTDMLAVSPPLEDYLVRTIGGLDVTTRTCGRCTRRVWRSCST
jgi:hypothetical protein